MQCWWFKIRIPAYHIGRRISGLYRIIRLPGSLKAAAPSWQALAAAQPPPAAPAPSQTPSSYPCCCCFPPFSPPVSHPVSPPVSPPFSPPFSPLYPPPFCIWSRPRLARLPVLCVSVFSPCTKKRIKLCYVIYSVVDPNPVGSETFNRIRIRIRKKSLRIWAAPDPKWIWSKPNPTENTDPKKSFRIHNTDLLPNIYEINNR